MCSKIKSEQLAADGCSIFNNIHSSNRHDDTSKQMQINKRENENFIV